MKVLFKYAVLIMCIITRQSLLTFSGSHCPLDVSSHFGSARYSSLDLFSALLEVILAAIYLVKCDDKVIKTACDQV